MLYHEANVVRKRIDLGKKIDKDSFTKERHKNK